MIVFLMVLAVPLALLLYIFAGVLFFRIMSRMQYGSWEDEDWDGVGPALIIWPVAFVFIVIEVLLKTLLRLATWAVDKIVGS